MKRFFIITMIICSSVLMIGCSGIQTDNKSNPPAVIDNSKSTSQDIKVGSADSSNDKKEYSKEKPFSSFNNYSSGKKEYYLKMLDDIQEKIDKEYNMQNAMTTYEMRNANGAQYDLWDGALNTIYNDLKNTLSPDDMKKLEKEELTWIAQKENDAKKESEKAKGGTLEQVLYGSSIVESTKKRSYELVNKYL